MMASVVFETHLTDSEKLTFAQRARSGCLMSTNGHLVVDGVERNQYAKVRVFLRGKSYSVYRHRLCYYVDNDFVPIPPDMQISHLCHLKSCCLSEHLCLESASVNNSRKQCASTGTCLGHSEGHANCVFQA